ncbi:hypothetical protein Halru_1617 [Halovivax ruber XH-70]|uniref:Right handed beta helix domain-containing protein n=1 Tax=Halovivax ruber (strain DSM 18193 / JCM 13892 / XH-70) TaxID=797302 RepID=L0IBT4_HALRX|nr:hypothetical protein [Halovivax ruber]AGB16224.1 hypothetical protein Halru_1617 [Halovivax ruber XH-70]
MTDYPRSHESPKQTTDAKSRLTRRSFVGSVAAGVTAAATGFAGAAAADEGEYETVTLASGERKTVTVDDGETLENVLYDCTAPDTHVTISATGTDWTVRNIGVKGRVDRKEAVFGVADTGGNTSTIENVYLGDGASDGHRIGLGIWVAPDHSGHLDIDGVNIQEMGDNSFYCSAPGSKGGGTVDIRNSYSANSWVSHFRLAEGTVENCVAVNDEQHKDGRGVWAWSPGSVEVRDCNLVMNGRHYAVASGANGSGSTVELSNTAFSTDYHGGLNEVDGGTIDVVDEADRRPEDVCPESCPESPTEAAAGQ